MGNGEPEGGRSERGIGLMWLPERRQTTRLVPTKWQLSWYVPMVGTGGPQLCALRPPGSAHRE